ncbi:diguanylate cyclase [Duganella violaceipulchra]|uniref:diguanylate cyclase n=1 Tax=Duganella violaceipulchra TaxID=2849652 RepID=A0AA41H549_9BURK|nr:diguanylate cyclase [Duganella violaceicalia]MBV6321828.1 diguanylate cyclase [Duganella violaceicalia]MCP2007178.1 diguanylate cyclase (GGDEF)-like protein [Duganella violaceicalia]
MKHSQPPSELPQMARAVSVRRLFRHGDRAEQRTIAALWLLSLAASIGLGLASVIYKWSGLPVRLGGVELYITVYPPLVICLLWTLTCGWWWGAIPAYLATLTLALYGGMPLPWALLFSGANPLGFAVMGLGYRAISASRRLTSVGAMLLYVQLAFVGAIFSSSGALVWCYTNRIDSTALLPIWQGWWLGAFLQSVLLCAPVLALMWPHLERWQQQRPQLLVESSRDPRGSVLRWLGCVTIGVLVYGFVTLQLADNLLQAQAAAIPAGLARALEVARDTTWAFYWVFALIVVFIAVFGYHMFIHWQTLTNQLLADLRHANQRLYMLAGTDSLTGLHNRRVADERIAAEWLRAQRLGAQAALVMIDIDHFKQINDRHGHPVGDEAIRVLATAIRALSREVDCACRYGGEEFVIILPQADAEGAYYFAERLRSRVAAAPVASEHGVFHFTVSVGIALVNPADPGHEAWIERSDHALYRAKRDGRNRVVAAAA